MQKIQTFFTLSLNTLTTNPPSKNSVLGWCLSISPIKLKLSVRDIMVSKKGSNGEEKYYVLDAKEQSVRVNNYNLSACKCCSVQNCTKTA